MIEKALRKKLRPIVNRRRRLYLMWRLSVYWFIAGIIGVALVSADWLLGWNSLIVNWGLCIATLLATVLALYKYSQMHIDYRAVARNIEQQHPDMQALLLAAIEQEPQGFGGQLGYLQERVIGDALRHADKHDWLRSISSRKLYLTQLGGIAALSFIIIALSQLLPSTPSFFTIDRGVLTGRDYNITVSPGDTTVELGAVVVVMARFDGRVPPEASLWVGTSEQDKKKIVLSKNLEDPVFGGLIPEVNNNLIYHIEYAKKRTENFRISAFEHPSLKKTDAKIVYPSYTKLPEKVIKDTRQISVVEGSEVTLTFTLNKPVTKAQLHAKNQSTINLIADNEQPNTYTTSITPMENQRFELYLTDAQGLTNKIPPRFTIDVHKNLPPELKTLFPNRDIVASPLEELSLEAQVSDDYGVTGYGLSYTLAGTQSRDITLGQSVLSNENLHIQHLLAFEEINAQPDQLLTYYFWADDIGPNDRNRRTSSDIYFAEVRHFEEIFRESQSSQQQNNQSQNQSGQQQQQQGDQLAKLQKQIISATWNVKKLAELSGGVDDHKEDLDVVQKSQADVLQQAQSAMSEAEDTSAIKTLQEAAGYMETSLEHLTNAGQSASTEELTPALASEQLAYQELLKLKDLDKQVARSNSRGRGSNSSSGSSGRSEQQLQQLEMTQQENRYETQRLAQSQQQTQREDLQVLNRLRELARRQNEMSERLKEAQAALQQAENEQQKEEIRRQLKRLTEQQLEALQDVDELRQRMERSENRQRMADAREQLDQSRSRIRQSAEELEKGMLSRAITSTTRAQRELEQMRDEFRKNTSGQFTEQMRNMRENAQQLDQRQNEIAEEIKQQIDSERKTLTYTGVNRDLAERIDRQREEAEKLIEQMKEVSEQSETSEPLLSRKLYDTLRKAGTDNVDRALEATGELLKRNFLPQAQEIEKQAGKGIEEMRKGVEEAAENVLGDEAESLRLARQQLDELIRQVNEEAARAGNQDRGQPNDSNEMADSSSNQQRPGNAQSETESQRQGRQSAQQPQGGRASANAATGGNRQSDSDPNNAQQQGSPRGSSRRQTANARPGRRAESGGRTGPGGWLDNQSGQWDSGDPNGPLTGRDFSQWSDRLRDVEEMLNERDLRNEAARIRDRARSIRSEYTRHGKEPQWDLVKRQITDPLTELHKHLSDKLAQLQSDEALVPIDRDPVPGRFAELVRRYYENLGGGD
ncbi:MAG: DUF4175 family protein [Sedimentisphaerales bacterium]|nr:DUF4175 family protein [Sedimentisphaerales bacterium]